MTTRFHVALVIDVDNDAITTELMIDAWTELAGSAVEGVRIINVEAIELT